jgi:hypothetical protein
MKRKPRRRRRHKKPTPVGEWAARTWKEVAMEFNRRHGTKLTQARMMQIGREAMEKLRRAVAA